MITERLLADLAQLDDRLWLVVDDVHELDPDALAQLELLIMRAPPELRLRRAEPDQVAGLHRAAAGWFAGHGYPAEAIRHAQAAGDWELAARLLAEHWPGLHLDGQAATIHELLAGFPAEQLAADAGVAAVGAGDEVASGSLEAAERHLTLAERGMALVPEGRQEHARLLVGMVRLLLARQRADPAALAEQARRLQALAEAPEAAQPALGEELRALAPISLGSAEYWVARWAEAMQHLEQGVALARRIGRPYLVFTGLVQWARSWSSSRSRGQPSSAWRRPSWPSGTAGPTTRPSAWLVRSSRACWSGRHGWRRSSHGSRPPNAL